MKLTQRQPLLKVSPYIFQAQYDKLGREAVKKILPDYKGTRIDLDTLNTKEKGPIRRSNIYYRFALGNAYRDLSNQDVLPINPRESEIALANNTLIDPTETYEDLGLIIYPKEGYNPVLWKHLREIAQTQYKDSVNLEVLFAITGLMKPVKDDKFEYNLRLDPIEGLTLMYNVPILAQGNGNFTSEDPELQRTGFPGKLGEGNRTLYASNNGVCRLVRDRYLGLFDRCEYLDDSGDVGRVHLVAKNSSGNLDELIKRETQITLNKFKKLKKYLTK